MNLAGTALAVATSAAVAVASPVLAQSAAGGPASELDDLRLYVPNQLGASISVLDGRGRLLETVDLRAYGFTEHAMPHQVAAAPDGSAWYVSLAGAGVVAAFDADNRLVARTPVEAPGMIVLDPRRGLLHVTRALAAVRPPTSLAVLRVSDLGLVEEPDLFVSRPHALAVDTVSGRVYAGSLADGSIAVFDPATGDTRVVRVEGAPNGLVGLAVSPDGSRLVATTQVTDRMIAFDATGPDLLVPIGSLPVESGPYDAAFSPDGRLVWFPNQQAGSVTQVDASTWRIDSVIRHSSFAEPHGVISSPDGRTLYVTSHGRALNGTPDSDAEPASSGAQMPDMTSPRANGAVTIIDVASGEVVAVAEVGPYAAAPGLGSPGP